MKKRNIYVLGGCLVVAIAIAVAIYTYYGTVKYTDSYESYEAKMQSQGGRLTFTKEDGYKYTLRIKKKYLILDAENTSDQSDPSGQIIYKKL